MDTMTVKNGDGQVAKKMKRRETKHSMMTKFKNEGEKFFYYLRDNGNHIFGGVCLKKVDGVWCRGITLWAEGLDQFDKDECKRQAEKRLIHAAFSKKDDYQVNPGTSPSSTKLINYYPEFFTKDQGFKSRYGANLTEKEKEIVSEPF